MKFRSILFLVVFCWCFTISTFFVLLFDSINQTSSRFPAVECRPLLIEQTRFAVIVRASDYSLGGDGTESNPYLLDTVFLNKTFRNLEGNYDKLVIDGGCSSYIIRHEGFILPSNSLFTRFRVIFDEITPKPVLDAENKKELRISNNHFIKPSY